MPSIWHEPAGAGGVVPRRLDRAGTAKTEYFNHLYRNDRVVVPLHGGLDCRPRVRRPGRSAGRLGRHQTALGEHARGLDPRPRVLGSEQDRLRADGPSRHGPRLRRRPWDLRDRIVQICLAVGIPVVVWDRARDKDSHAVERLAEVATRELPDGVRSYRANTMLQPGEYPGRPVHGVECRSRTTRRWGAGSGCRATAARSGVFTPGRAEKVRRGRGAESVPAPTELGRPGDGLPAPGRGR
ncbi:hypothetical protein ABT033_05050 [Streptomyces pharetrae]|uniref:VMAP-C domain-containing protein n=1 Tax=Streptomyces pharetrae TaxID=291370 RepID=UPI0033530BE5